MPFINHLRYSKIKRMAVFQARGGWYTGIMVLWHAITVSQHVVMTIPLYDIAFQHCIFLSDTI